MPTVTDQERYEQMLTRVRALYEKNRQEGTAPWCNKPYDFVCPSTGTYPFQWFWDSCFHTIVLSHFDTKRAQSELISLLENQQPDGFVAHVTFWQREKYEHLLSTYEIAYRTPYLSNCIQPPLLAEALYAASKQGADAAYLKLMLPKVQRYYDWLDEVRDPDQDGLIATLQPDESGLDHTPKYDAYLGVNGSNITLDEFNDAWRRVAKPYDEQLGRDTKKMFDLDHFIVEDVMVNTIYAENQRVLGALFELSGDPHAAKRYQVRGDRTAHALYTKCFDAERGLFFDLAGKAEKQLKVSTFTSLFPLLLTDLPASMRDPLVAQLKNPNTYGAKYPVPTVAMNEPTYAPDTVGTKLMWRGPSWLNETWYIARGLKRQGQADMARSIALQCDELIRTQGFREYYNPMTGEGHGARDFSWSALVLDMLKTLV